MVVIFITMVMVAEHFVFQRKEIFVFENAREQ